MRIYVIDDEPIALNASEHVIHSAVPDAQITSFTSGDEALEVLNQTAEYPDIVFSDVEMPGTNGLEFAVRLKQISPKTEIVFVTAYAKYAVEAFRVRANGYILKPLTADRVLEEIQGMNNIRDERNGLLKIRCFGSFEVFWKGEPLPFEREKVKELFAYLIDRKGALCSSQEIAAAILGKTKSRLEAKIQTGSLIRNLRKTLETIGQKDLLIRSRGRTAVRTKGIDCDYFRMLEGDMEVVNSYRGEYMSQYRWAEIQTE
ncbi:MAG: response regulator [Clostridia bacterium]|nr:response regulator [Clostridia bacterium]